MRHTVDFRTLEGIDSKVDEFHLKVETVSGCISDHMFSNANFFSFACGRTEICLRKRTPKNGHQSPIQSACPHILVHRGRGNSAF